ncbi:MAG TPA: phosphate acyltransferase PlsX [Thermoanaerobaculia bacterium]|nr:phosphate acyltransferase PlsX [Thermoanaerobaculia bacterium]
MAAGSPSDCRIALDAMGGDHAPDEILKGALLAVDEYPVEILLVGKEEIIRERLQALAPGALGRFQIVDAREVVEMEDNALAPLRKKRNSSIRVCANLIAEKRADSMVSAGHTGAAMTSAYKVLGTIEGVDRPALAAILPNAREHTVLLDVGANVDSKPGHLREFAVMGHFYAQMLFGMSAPRVGLLSIGEEEGKGNELTRGTFRVMKETGVNFIGNVEGRDVFNGNADVVVCDGFIGNVVLKASESLAEFVSRTLRTEVTRTPARKIGALLLKRAFEDLKKRMDYSEYGGAPLLGVNGGCIVCHGRSNPNAIKNAIRVARDFSLNRIDTKIREKIGTLHSHEHEAALGDVSS